TTTDASGHTVTYSEKRYKCDKCTKTYGRDRHLKRHQKRRHGVREPYRCWWSGCERRYPKEFRLKAHIRDLHRTRDYPFRCRYGQCERRFECERLLNMHRFRAHDVDYPYRCRRGLCGVTDGLVGYTTMNALRQHEFAKHCPYKCHYERCDRAYDAMEKLRQHRLRCWYRSAAKDMPSASNWSYRSEDRTYVCNDCSERFTNWTELKTHMSRSHKCDDKRASAARDSPSTAAATAAAPMFNKSNNDSTADVLPMNDIPVPNDTDNTTGTFINDIPVLITERADPSPVRPILDPLKPVLTPIPTDSERSADNTITNTISNDCPMSGEASDNPPSSGHSVDSAGTGRPTQGSQSQPLYKCDECDQQFLFGPNLADHKACAHSTTRQYGYVCQPCEHAFANQTLLDIHVRDIHVMLKNTNNDNSFHNSICAPTRPPSAAAGHPVTSYPPIVDLDSDSAPEDCAFSDGPSDGSTDDNAVTDTTDSEESSGDDNTSLDSTSRDSTSHDRLPITTSAAAAIIENTVTNTTRAVAEPSPKHSANVCRECDQSFKKLEDLNQHRHAVHSVPPPYRCSAQGCGKSYYTKWRLKSHCREHKSPNKCHLCYKWLRRPLDLIRHNHAVHHLPLPYPCDYDGCEKQFITKTQLIWHKYNANHFTANDHDMRSSDTSTASSVPVANSVANNNDYWLMAMTIGSLLLSPADTTPTAVDVIPGADDTMASQAPPFDTTPQMTANDGLKCDKCDECFAQDTDLNEHKRHIHDHHYRCGYSDCDKTFSTQDLLNSHTVDANHTPDTNIAADTTQIADAVIAATPEPLHPVSDLLEPPIPTDSDLSADNTITNTNTISNDHTMSVMEISAPNNTLTIDIPALPVPALAVSPQLLANYMNASISSIDTTYHNTGTTGPTPGLPSPLRATSQVLFTCDECDQTFIFLSNLAEHKACAHAITSSAVTIDKAMTTGNTVTDTPTHESVNQTLTTTGVNTLPAPNSRVDNNGAGDTTSRPVTTTTAAVANKSPPVPAPAFMCDKCHKRFHFERNLKQHELTIHTTHSRRPDTRTARSPVTPIVSTSAAIDTTTSDAVTTPSMAAKLVYNCDKCPKRFHWGSDLKKHKLSAHNNIPLTYRCRYEGCANVYATKALLCQHLREFQTHRIMDSKLMAGTSRGRNETRRPRALLRDSTVCSEQKASTSTITQLLVTSIVD
ncbi:unnamed protein product, partial [Medioppia subpectinata]